MRSGEENKQYRIGEYAHYLGVTPDFLKHYEQFGLIQSIARENGYRYYPFGQSYKIFECMRLRNYGITLRDMDVLMNEDDFVTIGEKLDQRAAELEAQMRFTEVLLQEQRWMSEWMARMAVRKTDWRIVEGEEMYFLPHSHRYDFIKDDRIYDILNQWTAYMPMVKSCAEIHVDPENRILLEEPYVDHSWGLIATKALVEQFQIPINDVVKPLTAGKWFIYEFTGSKDRTEGGYRSSSYRAAVERLKQLGLKPAKHIYKVILMFAHANQNLEQAGYVIIPIG